MRYRINIGAVTCGILLGCAQLGAEDPLKSAQQIASHSLEANGIRMRVAAENMANSRSANYEPKSVIVVPQVDRKTKVSSVKVQKITQDPKKQKRIYEPTHPQADEDGYVNMPDEDPLISMMNMQQARFDSERAMKAYEAATDQRQRIIKMMNH